MDVFCSFDPHYTYSKSHHEKKNVIVLSCITAQKNKFNKKEKKSSSLHSEMQLVKSCCCQGLDYSLQSTFVCDVQDLLQSLQWNGNSTVVSLSHLSMWYFLHQHVNPVKKEFKLSFPAVKLLCFGAVLAVWGMCQSPPWSLSHLKISSPLWGLCGRGISPYCENHSACFCRLHLLQLHAVRHYVFII